MAIDIMPRPYPKEFREGAVALARQGERRVAEIAKGWGSRSRVCVTGSNRIRSIVASARMV